MSSSKAFSSGDEPPTAEFFSSRDYVPTTKAYDNEEFLLSPAARPIRVLCEYQYPKDQLKKHAVFNTILFMGSSTALPKDEHTSTLKRLESELASSTTTTATKDNLEKQIKRLQKTSWLCSYYEKAKDLAHRLAFWGSNRGGNFAIDKHYICTGGGPGFMAAANHGASLVPGAKSIGMSVTMPKPFGVQENLTRVGEYRLRNPYVHPELAFEFHYFFTRKFWMTMPARAIVVMPGGLGTCDELFEAMTLMQCGKTSSIPVVLFGEKYWKSAINWDLLVERGTVSPSDRKRLFFTDDITKAFDFVTSQIIHNETTRRTQLAKVVGTEVARTMAAAPFEEQ
eukprot:GSMAST32.ASY1.ANO1.2654.1 assembled CDS